MKLGPCYTVPVQCPYSSLAVPVQFPLINNTVPVHSHIQNQGGGTLLTTLMKCTGTAVFINGNCTGTVRELYGHCTGIVQLHKGSVCRVGSQRPAYTNCGPGLTCIQSPCSARTEPLQSPYRARTEPAHKYQHPAHTAQDHQQDFVIDLDNLSLGRWRCAGYWYLWVGSVRALYGLCEGSVRVLYGHCLPPASGLYLT